MVPNVNDARDSILDVHLVKASAPALRRLEILGRSAQSGSTRIDHSSTEQYSQAGHHLQPTEPGPTLLGTDRQHTIPYAYTIHHVR